MSEENVDRLRRMVEAFNARDFEPIDALMHPDLVWYPGDEQPDRRPTRGRDAYLRYLREWTETFDRYEVEIAAMVDVGDCVAMAGHVRGSGRSSGVAVGQESAWVWRFRDGLAVEHRECRTMEEALAFARKPSFV
jgi:ketosteroid isomerase-like protein